MMGRRGHEQGHLFYEFDLDAVVPNDHLLRRMDVFVCAALSDLHAHLTPFYSDIGLLLVDPEADDPNACDRLLLRHPFRTPALPGSNVALSLPLVLPPRSRGSDPAPFNLLAQTSLASSASSQRSHPSVSSIRLIAAGDGGGNRIGSGCWPTRSANSTSARGQVLKWYA